MFSRVCPAKKKVKVPLRLFHVVWVPDVETKVLTVKGVLEAGGRIVESELPGLEANEYKRRLSIETEGFDGRFLSIDYVM
ncbi:hypothetical protein GCM10007916_28950 [Psychromonas marina]|uniref:BRCT domain-containing protein n=1 Tax=Psychromonas marina TaxID=88364 RepID=A0ABQ6E3E1_9GAMM|nr:hypothetical protein [Psychromonas marina]GLS91825.1 hypothetical protein GCM10007916_28950 [Psychromonas marina]